MRALVPVAIGAATGGGLGLRFWLRAAARDLASEALVVLGRELLASTSPSLDLEPWLYFLWQAGGLLICWELREELFTVLRILFTLVVYLSRLAIVLWISLTQWWFSGTSRQVSLVALSRTERDTNLTCMAAAAARPYPVGSFLLISRPPNWDEIWIAGYSADGVDIIARTTEADGSDWVWCIIKPVALGVMPPVVAAGTRRAPNGVAQGSVNWLCTPPACDTQWEPDAMEVVALTQEAGRIAQHMVDHPGTFTVNLAGTAGALVQLVMAAGALVPGGVGVGVPAASAGVAGLGLPPGGGNSPSNAELKALEAAVAQLQQLAITNRSEKKKDKSKKSKKSKKKDKKSKHKKKKRGRRSSTSSSSSSRSSRSRSRSSSSSSSASTGKSKPLKWQEKGKDRRVSYAELSHVEQLKLKKKGDLLAFAAKSPGALTAHFLASVHARLSKGTMSRSSQLREASAVSWAHQFSGLSEVRDLKEVLTLCEILDHINRREIARALDILCQRIVAIQAAKAKGGSWEKAEALELTNSQKTLASSSMLALTNA
eukprot:s576_g25.t1